MWKTYGKQWLVFFTSMMTGKDGQAECEAEFGTRYRGRIEDADWMIEASDDGRSSLLLCVPNCCGEFTEQADADKRAGEHAGHPHQVVRSGSAAERELLAYGTRRLRGQ